MGGTKGTPRTWLGSWGVARAADAEHQQQDPYLSCVQQHVQFEAWEPNFPRSSGPGVPEIVITRECGSLVPGSCRRQLQPCALQSWGMGLGGAAAVAT